MSEHVSCTVPLCGEPGATELNGQVLCLAHFIVECYGQLDACADQKFFSIDPSTEASMQTFLRQCLRCVVDLCLTRDDLDNLERARLFDILLRGGEVAAKRLPPPHQLGPSTRNISQLSHE